MDAKKQSYVRDSFSGTLKIFTITFQSNCCHLSSLNSQVQKNCILVEILQFSTSNHFLVHALFGLCCFCFMPFLVHALFGLCCFWFVLFLVGALFGWSSFWFVPFLVCALFGSCSIWFVPFLFHTLFGSCSFWFVLFLVCAQRYTYRVLQTIQMKVILLQVWAEGAVLGRAKTALKFKYEIQIG